MASSSRNGWQKAKARSVSVDQLVSTGKSHSWSFPQLVSQAQDVASTGKSQPILWRHTVSGEAVALRQWLERQDLPPMALDQLNDQGMAAMHLAVSGGHADCVRVLLMHGAFVDVRERRADLAKPGGTPLVLAAQLENLAIMRLLIDHHAELTACDRDGNTALAWAARNNQPEALELLLEARSLASHMPEDDDPKEALVSALRTALRNGVAESVCVILKYLGELVLPGDLADIAESEESRVVAQRALVAAYSLLPPEALARCVATAFKAWPCACLHGLIHLSAAAKQQSSKLRTRDIVTSENLRSGGDRLQLAVPASLGELNEQHEVNKLLRSPDGQGILPFGVRSECKLLLAQPTIQHFLNGIARGSPHTRDLHVVVVYRDAPARYAPQRSGSGRYWTRSGTRRRRHDCGSCAASLSWPC